MKRSSPLSMICHQGLVALLILWEECTAVPTAERLPESEKNRVSVAMVAFFLPFFIVVAILVLLLIWDKIRLSIALIFLLFLPFFFVEVLYGSSLTLRQEDQFMTLESVAA
eukprot:2544804-Amphidinium_carterae.1